MFSGDNIAFGMTIVAVVFISLAVVLGKDINNPKEKKQRSSKITGVVFLSIFGIIFTLFAIVGWYHDITTKSGLFKR